MCEPESKRVGIAVRGIDAAPVRCNITHWRWNKAAKQVDDAGERGKRAVAKITREIDQAVTVA